MKKYTYLTTILILAMGILGCSKEDQANDFKKDSSSLAKTGLLIPEFQTFDDLYSAIDQLNRMGEDDRRQYEDNIGYKSLLSHVYEIYEGIDMDMLQSENELLEYIGENPNYLTLRKNEDDENEYHAYFSDNEFSVVAGINRMLLVENLCYKIFDDGILSVNKDDMHLLVDLDDPYAENIPVHAKITHGVVTKGGGGGGSPNPSASCSSKNINRATDGSNRTKLKVRCHLVPIAYNQSEVRTFGRIRPYKRILGVWYYAKRTITGQIEYSVKYVRGTTHEINVNETVSPTLSYSQIRSVNQQNPPNQHASNIRFVSISSEGTTPSTGTASINCTGE